MKKLKSFKIFTILSSASLLIIALSVAYYLIIFLPKFKTTELEWEKISKQMEASQSAKIETGLQPSASSEPTNQQTTQTINNSETTKQACLKKVKAFEQFAASQGYSQEQIDQFIKLGTLACNNPGQPLTPTQKIQNNIDSLETKVDDLLRLQRGY